MNHDRPGLLCMANRGPDTNSAQFFITDEAAFHLDYDSTRPRSSGYTIFGECAPVELVHKIASVEMERGDKPKTPPIIKSVKITRKKAEKKAETEKEGAKDGAATDKAAAAPDKSATAAPEKTATEAPKKPGDPAKTPGKGDPADARRESPGPMAPRPVL